MKQSTFLFLLLLLLLTVNISLAQPCGERYLNPVFTNVIKTTIQYDVQPDYLGNSKTLFADLYTPEGDVATQRVGVIFVHGGGFIGGTRDGDNIPILCNNLARRGYVVASIDYRVGVKVDNNVEKGKAQIRAIQDLNSFIRFAKARGTNIGLDTAKIFIAGSSAGGATVLAQAFLGMNELPDYMDTTGVGSLSGRGNLNGIATKMIGVFSMWGAVGDTTSIKAGDVPVGAIQSVYDPCIHWNSGLGCNVDNYKVYGSNSIYRRATNLGIFSMLKGFQSDQHDLGLASLPHLDTTITQMTRFYYKILCPSYIITKTNEPVKIASIKVSPNPFTKEIVVDVSKPTNYKIYNINGALVKKGIIHNQRIELADLKKGAFMLLLEEKGVIIGSQKIIKN